MHHKNLPLLINITKELGAPKITEALELQLLIGGEIPADLKIRVLRTAKRFGKARFSQIAARHVDGSCYIPPYIERAVMWLLEK